MSTGRLAGVFANISGGNAPNLTNALHGTEFEDRFEEMLRAASFSALTRDQMDAAIWQEAKAGITDTLLGGGVPNEFPQHSHFVKQPYGTQQFPDFLVLEEDIIWSVESKYAKKPQGHPVWNSGPPRPNAIYLLGNAALRDVTFFRGSDVLAADDAEALHQFFKDRASDVKSINDRLRDQPYGFSAYIRKAFEQKRTFNRNAVLDFYKNPQRKELEASAIAYLKGERGQ